MKYLNINDLQPNSQYFRIDKDKECIEFIANLKSRTKNYSSDREKIFRTIFAALSQSNIPQGSNFLVEVYYQPDYMESLHIYFNPITIKQGSDDYNSDWMQVSNYCPGVYEENEVGEIYRDQCEIAYYFAENSGDYIVS